MQGQTSPVESGAAAGAGDSGANGVESALGVSLRDIDLQMVLDYAMPVAKVLILLIAAWFVAGLLQRVVRRGLYKAKFDETLTKFFVGAIRWAVLLLALILSLGIFGVETTSFAAVIGGASLAIGLAFQGTLGHLAAGIMLLIFRPFKVGDVVSAGGITGKIDEITLFNTEFDTFDNRRIIVPNGQIFGSTIENVSHHSKRRVDLALGVSYDADIDATRAVLERVKDAVPERLTTEDSVVVLTGLGASSVDWAVRVWVKAEDYWPVKERLIRSVKYALDEAGIVIPYPQMDVHVKQPLATP